MRHLMVMITALATAAAIAPPSQAYEDGLYFSFGLGYAHGWGDRGVPLSVPSDKPCAPKGYLWSEPDTSCVSMPIPTGVVDSEAILEARLDEVVQADPGAMLGLQLRFGYNILGHASVEMALSGAGTGSFDGGSVHVGGQARWHPVEIFIPHDDRDWDVSTFLGVGYSLAGYKPRFDADKHGGTETGRTEDAFDGKGWAGMHVAFGFGFDYQFGELASVGLDLAFIRPMYSTWYANFTEPYKTSPDETPSAWIFMPTARVTLHFWSPEG